MKVLNWTIQIAILLGFASTAHGQLKRANRQFDRLAYERAGKLYQRYLGKQIGDKEALRRLAACHRLNDDFKKTEEAYQRVIQSLDAKPEDSFYYGEALVNNGKWEESIPWFERFLEQKPEDELGKSKLWSSQNHAKFMEDSSLYDVKPTAINSAEADFGPSFDFSKNAVVFASARQPSRFRFSWNGRSFLDLYRADFGSQASLGNVERLRGRINTELHEGGQTLSEDGRIAFFSRNNIHKGRIGSSSEGVIRLKTFRAEERRGKFRKIKGIPFNNDEYSVGHPALSADQKTMYFASDMPGGEGGTDIYMVKLNVDQETWGEPVNLGPGINTAGEEMFPWIGKDGTLYFASSGHKGLGGLDLFEVQHANGRWAEVENMGYPINSPRDDFSLIFDENRGLGYFSSNRAGGQGDDDIYMFRKFQKLEGLVRDVVTGEAIENARIELYDIRSLQTQSRTDEEGAWTQGLKSNQDFFVVVSKDGYEEVRQKLSTKGLNPREDLAFLVELTKADCGEPIALEGTVNDSKGKFLPGTKVKIIKEEIVVADENGEISGMLDPESDYTLVVDEPGRAEVSVEVSTKGKTTREPVKAELVLPGIDSGKVFYVIYYDFDMYNIRTFDARPELDRVVAFMKRYPTVKVKLTSHTDSRATRAYNITLSKNRAEEAFEYIVENGIERERLAYDWKGEEELANRCADGVECSEGDHQLNRRTEFLLNGSTSLRVE